MKGGSGGGNAFSHHRVEPAVNDNDSNIDEAEPMQVIGGDDAQAVAVVAISVILHFVYKAMMKSYCTC